MYKSINVDFQNSRGNTHLDKQLLSKESLLINAQIEDMKVIFYRTKKMNNDLMIIGPNTFWEDVCFLSTSCFDQAGLNSENSQSL